MNYNTDRFQVLPHLQHLLAFPDAVHLLPDQSREHVAITFSLMEAAVSYSSQVS